MISIYPSNEKDFIDNGIKILKPLEAKIRKEDNGEYYLDIEDTVEMIYYYTSGAIVRANTPWGYQCFRLTNPTVENNKIKVRANHLFFDSANYLIADSYVVDKNCNDALDHLEGGCETAPPFTFISDITNTNSYRCVRKNLEEAINTVLERWGGHLVRDNWNIGIRQTIGEDRGVVLAYGKDITDMKTNEDWSMVTTKILPVGKDGLLVPEVFLEANRDRYDIPYSRIVEFDQSEVNQDDYKDQTTGELNEEAYQQALIVNLRSQAQNFLQENGEPKVNYSVSTYIDRVSDIGDTIYVHHPKCNVDITTKVIAIEYDCIQEKYTKIEFGNFKKKLENLVTRITSEVRGESKIQNQNTEAKLTRELKQAESKIMEAMGNSYVIYDGDKILVVDTLPKEEATNVIMINNGGISFSQNGINGVFNSAWTIDGTMDMQNINVINLVADMIKGGTLKLGTNLNEAGTMEIYNEANKLICLADKEGLTIYCENGTYIKLNPDDGFAGYDQNDNKIYWADGDEFHQKKAVVEEEITIANKIRIIPFESNDYNGIGFVSVS